MPAEISVHSCFTQYWPITRARILAWGGHLPEVKPQSIQRSLLNVILYFKSFSSRKKLQRARCLLFSSDGYNVCVFIVFTTSTWISANQLSFCMRARV